MRIRTLPIVIVTSILLGFYGGTSWGFDGVPDFSDTAQWRAIRTEPLIHIHNNVSYTWGTQTTYQQLTDSRIAGFERMSLAGEKFSKEVKELRMSALEKPKNIFLGVKRKDSDTWEIGTTESWWEIRAQIINGLFAGIWFDLHYSADEVYARFFTATLSKIPPVPAPPEKKSPI